jgi:hypothetical protein
LRPVISLACGQIYVRGAGIRRKYLLNLSPLQYPQVAAFPLPGPARTPACTCNIWLKCGRGRTLDRRLGTQIKLER